MHLHFWIVHCTRENKATRSWLNASELPIVLRTSRLCCRTPLITPSSLGDCLRLWCLRNDRCNPSLAHEYLLHRFSVVDRFHVLILQLKLQQCSNLSNKKAFPSSMMSTVYVLMHDFPGYDNFTSILLLCLEIAGLCEVAAPLHPWFTGASAHTAFLRGYEDHI